MSQSGRSLSRLNALGRPLLYATPLLFLAAFYVYPLASILRVSLEPIARQGAGAVLDLLGAPFIWQVTAFTFGQAALSTLLTLAAGMPVAYLFATYDFPGKTFFHALLTIPFVMPTVVVATAFLALLGDRGLLNQWLPGWLGLAQGPVQVEQSLLLILLAHVFFNVSVVIRTVGGFWSTLTPHLRESAAVLGASPWRVFMSVTLPLLMPSVLASALLVFLFCFTSFGVILLLGGPTFATLEVEIYRQAVNLFDLPMAGLLTLLQLVYTFTIMALYTRLQAAASHRLQQRARRAVARRPGTWRQWVILVGGVAGTLVALLAPLVALAVRSFTLGGELSLQFYAELARNPRQSAFFVPPLQAIGNSLGYALATLVLAVPLAVISAYLLIRPRGRWTGLLEPLLLLPLGTSAVTLGFGYIVALGPLRASPWLTPIAHTLIALPFVVRILVPALRAMDQRLREAAAVLGASPWRRWWTVDAPILTRVLLVGAVFAFTISLGEFGATLLITRPDLPTIPTVIYRALSRPGLSNYGQALAMSTILMGVTAAALMLIERFRLPGQEEF